MKGRMNFSDCCVYWHVARFDCLQCFFKGSNKDDGGCCSGCGCVILLLILAAMF
ncbi:hypothetical protein FC25_GL001646 [Ligilactobacillus ruminis DSM 20403 = NBRC 102161]|nr:hypothetical protein FC25_GL001646 [Ligilactobacillus ruminis DSM 20403 = NBRC 102161]